MNNLKEFSIPIKGLKKGVHTFNFSIDDDFFKHFESSPIQEAQFDVKLLFEKQDSFFDLTFDFEGTVRSECDRCTALIKLPYSDVQYVTVKFSEEQQEEDADIIYIHPEAHELNVAQLMYEFVCLALPYNKVYDCENDTPRPCDLEALKKLNAATPSVESLENDSKNPFDNLKQFFDTSSN